MTAAVDLAAKTKPRTVEQAPAVMRDYVQRPAVLAIQWWQVHRLQSGEESGGGGVGNGGGGGNDGGGSSSGSSGAEEPSERPGGAASGITSARLLVPLPRLLLKTELLRTLFYCLSV